MEIPPLLIQTAGSLVAILLLYLLARWLKLGGSPTLQDDGAVREVAGEVEDGFEPQRISISRGKDAALARDDGGRIMVIKRHGNRFAGRILQPGARVREEVDGLVVDPAEPRFGRIRLSIDDPAIWADAINRL